MDLAWYITSKKITLPTKNISISAGNLVYFCAKFLNATDHQYYPDDPSCFLQNE